MKFDIDLYAGAGSIKFGIKRDKMLGRPFIK